MGQSWGLFTWSQGHIDVLCGRQNHTCLSCEKRRQPHKHVACPRGTLPGPGADVLVNNQKQFTFPWPSIFCILKTPQQNSSRLFFFFKEISFLRNFLRGFFFFFFLGCPLQLYCNIFLSSMENDSQIITLHLGDRLFIHTLYFCK